MLKRTNIFYVFILLAILGGIIGYYTTRYSCKCLEIKSNKDAFYGPLVKELEKEMKKQGYNFNCPDIFPKTIIDFVYTIKTYKQNRYEKRKKDINIALVGDCFSGYDIEFLKKYDYLLSVGEARYGYLAMFNFKALHFPVHKDKSQTLCGINYDDTKVDIKNVSSRLDDIIKRAQNEKR